MKGKKVSTLTAEQLQELFDRSREVKQEMLREYLAIQERIRFTRHIQEYFNQTPPEIRVAMQPEYSAIDARHRLEQMDLEAVGAEIIDLLITKGQVEPGPITATLLSGRLAIDFKTEDWVNCEVICIAQ